MKIRAAKATVATAIMMARPATRDPAIVSGSSKSGTTFGGGASAGVVYGSSLVPMLLNGITNLLFV